MQSINNKILEIKVLLAETMPDIFCVSEHWLGGEDIQSVTLDDYLPVAYSSRTEFRGGGTAIFARSELGHEPIKIDTVCTEKHFEYCVCQITVINRSYIVVCVYRSPVGNLELFLSELDIVLNSLYVPNRCLLVCGDFNVNFQQDDNDVRSVLQLMAGYGMEQHVMGVTRDGRC